MDITQPFYWNLRRTTMPPSPPRFMDRRGLMERSVPLYITGSRPIPAASASREPGGRQTVRRNGQPQRLPRPDGHRYLLNARHTSRFLDKRPAGVGGLHQGAGSGITTTSTTSPQVGTQVDNQLQRSLKAGYFRPELEPPRAEVRTSTGSCWPAPSSPTELMLHPTTTSTSRATWAIWPGTRELTSFGCNQRPGRRAEQGEAYTHPLPTRPRP